MAAFEGVVVCYVSVLMVAAWTRRVPLRQRMSVIALGVAVVATLQLSIRHAPGARPWLGLVYLVIGYWMPALLVPARSSIRFEAWLVRSDDRLRALLPALPAALATITELAYLLCYPLVPLAFAIVWLNGSATDVDRFWLSVLLSGYACYVTLPWLTSRPPRLLRDSQPRAALAHLNARVLSRVSHQFNTFPSGHVAVSSAAAAAVAMVSPAGGLLLAIVVAAICVGAAAGRYHYVVDVLLGLAVGGSAHAVAAAL
jgi:membrane-associated phospholipid phosphatase